MRQGADRWEFWIDVGGTFTDCIGRSPDGSLLTRKVLSSGRQKGRVDSCSGRVVIDMALAGLPDNFYTGYRLTFLNREGQSLLETTVTSYDGASGSFTLSESPPGAFDALTFELYGGEEAPVYAIRMLMGLRLDQPIGEVALFLGTTRGTNALLEHKGCRLAYVTTAGFGDVMVIGTQARPELFRLEIKRPEPLYRWVVELDERVNSEGEVIRPLSEESIGKALASLPKGEVDAVAVCLVNSYCNPGHEQLVKKVASDMGFSHISLSSELTPTIQLLPRAGTAIINAYLAPVVKDYVAALRRSLPDAELRMMTSAGGLVNAEHFCGKDSLLSGPAGGVVGLSQAAIREEVVPALGFDMGGTSTDVSRFAGELEYCYRAEEEGVPLVAPMLSIHTVAAGGGSICGFDGQRLRVGPESAGADPGPACYGRGGPLTVTDVNLFNGKVASSYFPFQLHRDAVAERLQELVDQIEKETGRRYSLEELADGFTHVANQAMATAIKAISSARGYDPGDHTLVAFGGAGPQHACAIATMLGVRSLLLPPLGGILSAYGIGMADVVRFSDRTVLQPFTPETLESLDPLLREMERHVRDEMADEGVTEEAIQPPRFLLDLRYVGEEATLTVPVTDFSATKERFEQLHQQLYGLRHEGREVEIATARIELTGCRPKPHLPPLDGGVSPAAPVDEEEILFDAKPHRASVYRREELAIGQKVLGPALIVEGLSTLVVDPGWEAAFTEQGSLLLQAVAAVKSGPRITIERDPIHLELFHNAFAYIATQMGIALQKASLSVNVKERLDFSCAVLDEKGRLVANAPHIPVHLGAMGECVQGLLSDVDDLQPGDVYLSNDPALGGSHLPDLTVMTPVFVEGELRFFTASRAHHAEIGGVTPGSFYPFAKNLAEEGVVIRNLRIARAGTFAEETLREILASGPYPSRSPQVNIADIRAAVAANNIGEKELRVLIDQHGWPVVSAYMGYIREATAEKVRKELQEYEDGLYRFEDRLDDGSPIKVVLTIKGGSLTVDFSGSGEVNSNSLNANRAVVIAAVMYCMRCLIDEDIPLNGGMLEPVDLILPEGMLNPPASGDPSHRAAVVAGNVEISQRLVDVILGALKKAAASQGTMNNVIFGDASFGYYETIGGGVGAADQYDGASAVHSHMTNTRITDVEILEKRYPVRLRRFAVRKGSGGEGRRRGGDGIIREFEFLRELDLSLLTQRRETAPFGLAGGAEGSPGKNLLFRSGVEPAERLPSLVQLKVKPGDVLRVKTPGGGGWGDGR